MHFLFFAILINIKCIPLSTIVTITACTFRLLYISLVRPHLDYVSSAWNPCLPKDIRSLKSVQRRATRLVQMLKDKSYHDYLISLNLPSLQYRHKHMDMIMTY